MSEKQIHFSDLSGEMIENPDELYGIVITEHPDLDQPVRIEAKPEELSDLGKYSIAAVGLEVTPPDEDAKPTRYILTVNNFNKLSKRPMTEVLAEAQPIIQVRQQRRSHNVTSNGEHLRSFDTLESAGLPHQGRVSAKEAQLVRENLDGVNTNRARHGLPPISPQNAIDARRYGLGSSAESEQAAEEPGEPEVQDPGDA